MNALRSLTLVGLTADSIALDLAAGAVDRMTRSIS